MQKKKFLCSVYTYDIIFINIFNKKRIRFLLIEVKSKDKGKGKIMEEEEKEKEEEEARHLIKRSRMY